ncbi:MAG: hypothetical protein JWP87_5319 [Labilithrix sp.]|nr:hypothetical protein [Labilithrix sp.]
MLPAEECAPGTRAALGSASCVPVGVTACAPGFAKGATGWGCDAVIAASACAPAGATIAVDTGTYVEKVALPHRAVKIIGRCAEKVVMQQAAGVLGSAIEAAANTRFVESQTRVGSGIVALPTVLDTKAP